MERALNGEVSAGNRMRFVLEKGNALCWLDNGNRYGRGNGCAYVRSGCLYSVVRKYQITETEYLWVAWMPLKVRCRKFRQVHI